MLKELTLYGEVDKVQLAINRLRLHEPKEGYYVAFSGGKDSCVVLDLCKRAGVKYDAHYALTTVDPPEVIYFIRRYHPDAWENRIRPETSMWNLIPKKRMPPTQRVRYCCKYFKERGGEGRFVVTGVRHQESAKRAKRRLVETCTGHSGKRFIHPIAHQGTRNESEPDTDQRGGSACQSQGGSQRCADGPGDFRPGQPGCRPRLEKVGQMGRTAPGSQRGKGGRKWSCGTMSTMQIRHSGK